MANIDPYIEQIRVAEYGEEVRGSIINALTAENAESTAAYDAAITAQNSAQNSAAAAATSAATATQGVSDVNTAVANAISTLAGYDSSAKTSATNAANSATSAATSAANAKTSEINAKASENAVTAAAAAAKTSETNAKTSETNAKASETLAGNSATAAQTAASNAQQYASNALTSATTASNAQTAASNSAGNAAQSAQEAKDYAAQAQAASGIDIATEAKPGLVRPDGETIKLLDSTGRIGVSGLKEHVADTIFSNNENRDGAHGIRIYVDPTTKKRTIQRWNDTDKVWEEQLTDVKVDDKTIEMSDDGTINAVVDAALSETSENPVQNKVVNSHVTSRVLSPDGVHGLRFNADEELLQAFDGEKWIDIETGGGGSAQLIVTTNESDLVGLDVVLTLNGSEVGRLPFDSTKRVVFEKLKFAGEYLVTCGEASSPVQLALGESKTVELSLFYAYVTVSGTVNLAPEMDSNYTAPSGYVKPNSVAGFQAVIKDADSGSVIDTQIFPETGAVIFKIDTRTNTNVVVEYSSESGFTKPANSSTISLAKGDKKVTGGIWVEKYASVEVTRGSDLVDNNIVVSWGSNNITYTETGTQTSTFILKNADSYTASCGDAPAVTFNVADSQLDGRALPAVSITTSTIYGISRTVGVTTTAWTRTDLAEGLTATASVGTTAGHSDFETIKPWSDMKRETIGTDVMVKIPEFYYERKVVGGVETIRISATPAAGFTKHPGSGKYIGAYKTSGNNKSVKGAAPTVSQTRATMRNNAKAKGTGWSLIDIAAWNAIQMLYLVEFADNNSQAKLGRGYCDGNSAALSSGSCDSLPTTGIYMTGRPAGTDGKTDVCYRGIEGIYGNIWEFVDGANISDDNYYICTDITKYADDTAANYTKLSYTKPAAGYIMAEGCDSDNSWAMLPSASGGTDSTGYADNLWVNTGWRICVCSGYWNHASAVGLFIASLSDASSRTSASLGSRLLYTPS